MKKTLVAVLLILSFLTVCSKNVDYDTDGNLIKVCSSSWGTLYMNITTEKQA